MRIDNRGCVEQTMPLFEVDIIAMNVYQAAKDEA